MLYLFIILSLLWFCMVDGVKCFVWTKKSNQYPYPILGPPSPSENTCLGLSSHWNSLIIFTPWLPPAFGLIKTRRGDWGFDRRHFGFGLITNGNWKVAADMGLGAMGGVDRDRADMERRIPPRRRTALLVRTVDGRSSDELTIKWDSSMLTLLLLIVKAGFEGERCTTVLMFACQNGKQKVDRLKKWSVFYICVLYLLQRNIASAT